MTTKQFAIFLGGIVPGLLLGFPAIFQKLGGAAGIGTGPFLIGVGLTTALVGGAFILGEREALWTTPGLLYTALFAVFWATAIGCVSIALRRYGGQISQLVPLYNLNTLVTVLIGLFALAEWRTVNAPKLILAAVLIILGGVLAARA
ncbi:MAG TPA: hypothetical protein VF593_10035 [Chthoniobacteraceae bacterium]